MDAYVDALIGVIGHADRADCHRIGGAVDAVSEELRSRSKQFFMRIWRCTAPRKKIQVGPNAIQAAALRISDGIIRCGRSGRGNTPRC